MLKDVFHHPRTQNKGAELMCLYSVGQVQECCGAGSAERGSVLTWAPSPVSHIISSRTMHL